MKKILIILGLLISGLISQAQGVKISAMPTWTTSLDSVWFPIIDHSTDIWINYRAQGYQIGKERIDSIVNNWPAGGSIPTWQNTLDVLTGNVLTHTNHIAWTASDTYSFYMRGAKEFDFTAGDSAFSGNAAQVNAQTISLPQAWLYSQTDGSSWAQVSAVQDFIIFASTASNFQFQDLPSDNTKTLLVAWDATNKRIYTRDVSTITGGGGTVTANRGLHIDPANNVRWGGTLDSEVVVDATGWGIDFNQGSFYHSTGDFTTFSAPFTQLHSDETGFGYDIGDGTSNPGAVLSSLYLNASQAWLKIYDGANEGAELLLDNTNHMTLYTNTGELFAPNLTSATTSNVIYYNTSTGKLTYGAAPTGGGGAGLSINAANGLTMRNDSTVILGGTLDQVTNIDATSSYYLDITGARTGTDFTVGIHNTSSGDGLYATSSSGAAIRTLGSTYGVYSQATASNSVGVRGESSGANGNGVVGYASATTGIPVQALSFTADQSADLTTLVLNRSVSAGGGTDGIGNRLRFSTQTTLLGQTSTDIVSEWTTAASASRVSDLVIYGVDNAVLAEKFRIKGGGNVIITTAGKALGITSPDGTVWYVTVNNSGVLSTSTTAP